MNSHDPKFLVLLAGLVQDGKMTSKNGVPLVHYIPRIPQGITPSQAFQLRLKVIEFGKWQQAAPSISVPSEFPWQLMDERGFYSAMRICRILGLRAGHFNYLPFQQGTPWPMLLVNVDASTPNEAEEMLLKLAEGFFLVPEVEWTVGCKAIDIVDMVTGTRVALQLPVLVESHNPFANCLMDD